MVIVNRSVLFSSNGKEEGGGWGFNACFGMDNKWIVHVLLAHVLLKGALSGHTHT